MITIKRDLKNISVDDTLPDLVRGCESYDIGGRTVASARDRDSGAIISGGVVILTWSRHVNETKNFGAK